MTRNMKRLLRELDLEQGCPAVDAKAVKRRVNAALNADPSERKAYMRQKIKMTAVLVAAVVALTGTALAVGPTLQELVSNLLGSYAPYAQEVAGASATDQGIEVKVLSAVADHTNAKIILGVRDLKGSRISEGDLRMIINASREMEKPTGWGYGTQYMGYDPETRTALYQVDFSGMYALTYEPDTDTPITLNISAVKPGYHDCDRAELPAGLITDAELRSSATDKHGRVLDPNQTPAALEGTDGVSISSIGFAENGGLLHVQFRMPEGALEEHNSLELVIERISASTPTDSGHVCYNNGPLTEIQFWEDGVLYKDITYPITREELKRAQIGEIVGSFRTAAQIDGEWNLTAALEELPIRTIAVNQPIGGTMVKTISMTSISASAETELIPDVKPHYGVPGLPLTLYSKDGTIIPSSQYHDWHFDAAIDPNDVTALAIGMWYIPLEGDNALPGHWLTELPE